MGRLSAVWIVPGVIIIALGSYTYMDLIVKSIPEPVAMLFFGTCLVSFARLMIGREK